MYIKEEKDGTLSFISRIPNSIKIDNMILLGLDTASEEDQNKFGYFKFEQPDIDRRLFQATETLKKVGNRYTFETVARTFDLDKLKEDLLSQLKSYFKEAYSEGKPYTSRLEAKKKAPPTEIQTKISELYTLVENLTIEINNLDSIQSALDYRLPLETIDKALEFLRKLI